MIFRHIVGTGGRFLRAVKHNRSRKRAAIIHVIAGPGCWNTRRVVVVPYIPPRLANFPNIPYTSL